jgi:hypothetical protein
MAPLASMKRHRRLVILTGLLAVFLVADVSLAMRASAQRLFKNLAIGR